LPGRVPDAFILYDQGDFQLDARIESVDRKLGILLSKTLSSPARRDRLNGYGPVSKSTVYDMEILGLVGDRRRSTEH
jgi:hypothetical protein